MQERVYRSTRVWNLYLDLEESLGTVETAKAAYERALEVRVSYYCSDVVPTALSIGFLMAWLLDCAITQLPDFLIA